MDCLIPTKYNLIGGGLFESLICFNYWNLDTIEITYHICCESEKQKMILPFCFPEEGSNFVVDSNVFTFTLTTLDKTRKVAYCKRSTEEIGRAHV